LALLSFASSSFCFLFSSYGITLYVSKQRRFIV